MGSLSLRIIGSPNTVSVYLNERLLSGVFSVNATEYTYAVTPGVWNVRLIRNAGIPNRQWKKKVAFNWLSCLSGVPDFTLKEVMSEANTCSACFQICVSDPEQAIDLEFAINASGFEIVRGSEFCGDIQYKNEKDSAALKRIKLAYVLPATVFLTLIFAFLAGIAVFFLVKGVVWAFLLTVAMIVLLAALFCGLYQKSVKEAGRCCGNKAGRKRL